MIKEQIVLIKGTTYRASSTGYIINKYGRPLMGTTQGGYVRCTIKIDGKYKSINTARIIYEAFCGPIPNGYEIDHINGNSTDNRLSNLRVCTHKENMQNSITRQRLKKPRKRYAIKYEKLQITIQSHQTIS